MVIRNHVDASVLAPNASMATDENGAELEHNIGRIEPIDAIEGLYSSSANEM